MTHTRIKKTNTQHDRYIDININKNKGTYHQTKLLQKLFPKHDSTPSFTEIDNRASLNASPESTSHVVHQPIPGMVQGGHGAEYVICHFGAAGVRGHSARERS